MTTISREDDGGLLGNLTISLQIGERLLEEGWVTHIKGIEPVGGKLWLTNQRLHFKSHNFNFQPHEESIPIKTVHSARLGKRLGIFPTLMIVTLADGREEIFGSYRRKAWVLKIQKVLSQITTREGYFSSDLLD